MRTTLLSLCLIACALGHAQERQLKDVLYAKVRGAGVIMKNNQLGGYYSFYETDKVDGGNRAFRVALMDDGLNEVGEIKLIRPKYSYLMETVFNGSAFMFFFLNKENVELETYDASGKKMGKASYEDETKFERTRAYLAQQGGESAEVNASIFPLGSTGFLKQSAVKGEKLGYQLTAYNNDMSVRWKTGSENDEMIEQVDIIEVNEEYIIGSLYKQKSRMDMPDESFMIVFDAKTGKKLWDKEVTADGMPVAILNAFIEQGKSEFFLVGEYFAPDANPFKDKSIGFCAMRMNSDGTITTMKRYDWQKDVLPFIPANEKGEKEIRAVFFHKVVKLSNGTVHLIGEQFKKAFSALGLVGGGGALDVVTDDMVVVELGDDLTLKTYEVVPKSKTKLNLPTFGAMYSTAVLGKLLKQYGWFDYAFTMQAPKGDRYYSTYVDYDRSKNESGDKVGTYAGTIVGDGVSKVTVDKLDMKTKGTTFYMVLPGKPGYLAVYSYSRKLKQLDFRLEKVNF